MSIDSKKFEHYKISLIKKQDWLDCRKQLEALDNLFKECSNEEERGMLLELISYFTCTDDNAFWRFCLNQAKDIVNDGTITIANCIIGPTTDNEEPDSSQHVCNSFRNMLRHNGGKHIVKNLFRHVETFIKSTKEKNINIIILDDFIGSGNRIVNKIKRCKELVNRNEYTEGSNFKVISFVAMEAGKQYIEEHGAEVITEYILKKGITDFFTEPKLSIAKSNMLRMESLIFDNPGSHSYSFGYEQSEALYARVVMKTTDPITLENDILLDRAQNNVFPIFWRHSYKDGQPRKTLLYR